MQTLLVAVPRAVFLHGADHQIHAVGRGHLNGVLPQRQQRHLRLRLPALGDGDETGQHQMQIGGQRLPFGVGIGAVGLLHRRAQQRLPAALLQLLPLIGLQLIHQVGQHDGPAEIQGHQLCPVEQQQKRRGRRVILGRDHVDAHHTRPLGIQRDMPHAIKMCPAVAPFAECHVFHRFLLWNTMSAVYQHSTAQEKTQAAVSGRRTAGAFAGRAEWYSTASKKETACAVSFNHSHRKKYVRLPLPAPADPGPAP